MSQGFYKYQDGVLIRAGKFVYSPVVTLLAENKDDYTYPADGWYWFNSKEEALAFWSLPEDVRFME